MAAIKPSIPKGTRDFSPLEMSRRNYIFNTISSVFKKFGFSQIETPSMENLSTLMGKYGEEGDKLLFKILNSGDFLRGVDKALIEDSEVLRLATQLCEKGLRYDLTVPFARYVVQHRNDIIFPFKRYQIQPVWRADRPQKGRYREFYQCDADIVGSDSLWNEVALLQMIDEVFSLLGIRVQIKLNNRKVLAGIAEIIGEPDKIVDITVAIDKIDKIGIDNVEAELIERGLKQESVNRLRPILRISGTVSERLGQLEQLLSDSVTGMLGITELKTVISRVEALGINSEIDLDVSLARGLNYYTGIIIEVKSLEVAIGSISGGGRYDNLTGVFGLAGVSGVGISFGADRIYDVLTQLERFPADTDFGTEVIFVNLGEKEALASAGYVKELRKAGIVSELFPDNVKIQKQFKYADAKKIPYVAIVGEEEIVSGNISLKNMKTGEQQNVSIVELIDIVNS